MVRIGSGSYIRACEIVGYNLLIWLIGLVAPTGGSKGVLCSLEITQTSVDLLDFLRRYSGPVTFWFRVSWHLFMLFCFFFPSKWGPAERKKKLFKRTCRRRNEITPRVRKGGGLQCHEASVLYWNNCAKRTVPGSNSTQKEQTKRFSEHDGVNGSNEEYGSGFSG